MPSRIQEEDERWSQSWELWMEGGFWEEERMDAMAICWEGERDNEGLDYLVEHIVCQDGGSHSLMAIKEAYIIWTWEPLFAYNVR